MSAATSTATTNDCVVCAQEHPIVDLIRTRCDHEWCHDCIRAAFIQALRYEREYPPRCCGRHDGEIQLEDVIDLFDEVFINRYLEKQKEYRCPRAARLYCAKKACSNWIPPEYHGLPRVNAASCEACKSLTCLKCKQFIEQESQNHVCRTDDMEQMLLDLAERNHFQRCYNCGVVVELAEACNHMECSECHAEFCYICAKPWPGEHGCPSYNQANYDKDGYNQKGYHRDTQLDRKGRDFWGMNSEGYDRWGYHRDTGVDRYGNHPPFSPEFLRAFRNRYEGEDRTARQITEDWQRWMATRPQSRLSLRGGGEEIDGFEGPNEGRFGPYWELPTPREPYLPFNQPQIVNARPLPALVSRQQIPRALPTPNFHHLPPINEQRQPQVNEHQNGFMDRLSQLVHPNLQAIQPLELPPPYQPHEAGAFTDQPGQLTRQNLERAHQHGMFFRHMTQMATQENRRLPELQEETVRVNPQFRGTHAWIQREADRRGWEMHQDLY